MTKMIDFLDKDKINLNIQPKNHQKMNRLDIFNTINSTNSYLLDQAKANGPTGWVCVAEQQTSGRGRQGKVWYSPPMGNIYLSLLWRFSSSCRDKSHLSIAIAVMIARVLKKSGVSQGLELKWPNDVMYKGKKLAGILLESVNDAVVMGVGLNCVLPKEADLGVSLEDILGYPVPRNELIGQLLDALLTYLPVYESSGLQSFLAEWQERDILRGKTVEVISPHVKVVGVAQGVLATGELQVATETGVRVFRCGEVSVRNQIL